MKVSDLYSLAMSLLPTNSEEDNSLERYMPGWTNILLAESMKTENSIRYSKGLPLLETPSTVSAMTDEIPIDESIAITALPYGIAEHIAKDDNDDYWARDFRARHIAALNDCMKLVPESVDDVYGGSQDA